MAANHPDVETVGLSLSDIDLTDPASTQAIAKHLTPDTAVVMSAAIKRQLGDSPDIYLQNTAMLVNFANLITNNPVRRVVYLSSAAVYGEDIENLSITEASPINCRTYYGLSKHTAEWMLNKVADGENNVSIGHVRPATIYGPGDLGTAYGPSGFLNKTMADEEITLWGDGSELREFLYIDDVAAMLARYVFLDHHGPVNLVSGNSYTFQDSLEAIAKATGKTPDVNSRERSKDKVDNKFDNTLLRQLMPDLSFTSLEDGVRLMYDATQS